MSKSPRTIKKLGKTQLPFSDINSELSVSKTESFFVRPTTLSLGLKKKKWSIDFFSLLQYREYIAGLAVLEDSLVYMLYRSASESISSDASSKEFFPSGVIVDGILHDKEQYTTVLRRLFDTVSGRHASSVILSVLPQHVWMTTLEFPKTLDRNSLIEAINLYFEFTLPFPKNESYIDWEILDDHNSPDIQRVGVGAVYKKHIDPYLDVLKKEGITAIAVESHLMSVARCFGNGRTLYIIIYPSGVHIGAYTDDMFRFQRFVLWEHIQRGKDNKKSISLALLDEIKSIMHFLRTEAPLHFEIENIIVIASQDFQNSFTEVIKDDPISTLFKNEHNGTLDPAQMIVRGAALRGLFPRKDDTIMSFTAVGTEKVYEWKRAISFSAFFEKLAIGLCVFFILLYLGSYGLVTTLAQRAESRQSAQGAIFEDLIKIQDEAKRFNEMIDKISKLVGQSPHWEKLFNQITHFANPGIIINSLSVDDPSSIILTGTAANRDALLQFKALVNSSGIFHDVELPFFLLITKENLPFRFSLTLRDKMFLLTP